MTDGGKGRRRRLSHEILGLIGIGALLSVILFMILSGTATVIAESYCFDHDVPMTEFDWLELDRWILGLSMLVSVVFFSILFLSLLGERLAYIRRLTKGIEALRTGEQHTIPLEGNNELTALAGAINEMSVARQKLKEKESALAQEKEQLIRTLSHDIRTPLTSIMAYSDFLASKEEISAEDQRAYLQLIQRKTQQIRELTDILLDGGKRNLEQFEDARLLMEQLAAEFEEELEDSFTVETDFSGCPAFSGSFDVQELRRIMDNLGSNVQKYADPAFPVELTIGMEENGLTIRQRNRVSKTDAPADSYKLGISSIRRIAQHYGGQAVVRQDAEEFSIAVTLSEF